MCNGTHLARENPTLETFVPVNLWHVSQPFSIYATVQLGPCGMLFPNSRHPPSPTVSQIPAYNGTRPGRKGGPNSPLDTGQTSMVCGLQGTASWCTGMDPMHGVAVAARALLESLWMPLPAR